MKLWHIGWALLLTVIVLAGCRGSEPTPAADAGLGDTYTSEALDASYPSALNASSQLMLGTIKLEGTEHAVTPGQAKVLLPLWQAFQGGALQASAERNAVLARIEAQMTPAQLEAIAAMQLTPDDLRAWAQDRQCPSTAVMGKPLTTKHYMQGLTLDYPQYLVVIRSHQSHQGN